MTAFDLCFDSTRIRVHSELPEATSLLQKKFLWTKEKGPAHGYLSLKRGHPYCDQVKNELQWRRELPLWGGVKGDHFQMTDGESLACVHYPSSSAELTVADQILDFPLVFSRTFLLVPLLEILRCHGWFYVHGALLKNSDRSHLFLGQGGSGKSTLAISLMMNGWKLISDDNFLIRKQFEGCQAIAFEKELSAHEDIISLMPYSFETDVFRNKHFISYHDLDPKQIHHGATPECIHMLDDSFKPSPSGVLNYLMYENPMALAYAPLSHTHIETFSALIRQCSISKLKLGRRKPLSLEAVYEECLYQLTS